MPRDIAPLPRTLDDTYRIDLQRPATEYGLAADK